MNRLLTYLTIVTMFMVTTDAFAQLNEESVTKAFNCYEKYLQDENEGVVKSSIQNIMKLKVFYPEKNYSKLIKKLEKLSLEAESKSIRYNAYVAANFLKYPEQFNWDLPNCYEELDAFFQNLDYMFYVQMAQIN